MRNETHVIDVPLPPLECSDKNYHNYNGIGKCVYFQRN